MKPTRLLPLFALVLACSGCDKRAPLRADLESAEIEQKARQAELHNLQSEAKTLNATLGTKFSMAGPTQIERLNKEIEELKARAAVLQTELQAAKSKNEAFSTETNAFRAKHSQF